MGRLRLLVGSGGMEGAATWEVSLEESRQSTAFLASRLFLLHPLALEQDYGASRRQLRRRA
ncbi:MAG TPA: hypothetical protein VH393_09445 [Ktedonobacterales bacterium]|jgi:hypothetical protein